MAIRYTPSIGSVLICDFSGNKAPEIVKRRPVIVLSTVSPGLCVVVPCSTTAPVPERPHHYKLTDFDFLPPPYNDVVQWVKCDMVQTVSYDRLNMPYEGKDSSGKRKYRQKIINKSDFINIQKAVIRGLGLNKFIDNMDC